MTRAVEGPRCNEKGDVSGMLVMVLGLDVGTRAAWNYDLNALTNHEIVFEATVIIRLPRATSLICTD